jgi:SulP family sulfate permease
VFFGTASGLLERIRKRVEGGAIRFLVLDLGRVTGVDASGVLAFRKVAQLAEASGFEVVLTGVADRVRRQLERGGVGATDGVVTFEPDLDRGLQRCEDALLRELPPGSEGRPSEGHPALPPHLMAYLERRSVPEGTVLIRQGDPPDEMFVLESGHLRVETTTPEGSRMRLSSVRPGVVVGEMAMYMGVPRTADVVAETPCVVLGLNRAAIERLEVEEPETAAALHRWLATTLAARLTDAQHAYAALLD